MKHTERDDVPVSARNLRLDAGLSATEVARRMGVAPSALSRFERRRGEPSASTIIKFLGAVDRSDLSYLVADAARILMAARGGAQPRSVALANHFRTTGDAEMLALMRAVTK